MSSRSFWTRPQRQRREVRVGGINRTLLYASVRLTCRQDRHLVAWQDQPKACLHGSAILAALDWASDRLWPSLLARPKATGYE